MQRKWLSETKQYTKRNNLRRAWRRVVRVLACIVVFCTVYALILPAITMEKSCEIEEHTHTEGCYAKITVEYVGSLACSYESLAVHVHTDDCYAGEATPSCGQADFVVHEHTAHCRDEAGALVCELPVVEAHTHSEACYQIVEPETEPSHVHDDDCYTIELGELICATEETEGHAHGEGCHTQGALLCQIEESEGHTHGNACYMQSEPLCQQEESEGHTHSNACYMQSEPLCQQEESEEHAHSDACYMQSEPLCQKEETEGHTHSDACYMQKELLCRQEESEGHTHDSDCYEKVLTCELEELEGHKHSDECYEQKKTLICTADETVPETTAEATEPEPELVCTKTEIKLHSHDDACYEVYTDDEGTEQKRLVCAETVVLEHIHSDSCILVMEVPRDDVDALNCGLTETEGHTHVEDCYDESGQLACTAQVEAHTHSTLCYGTWERICGKDEHVHDEACQPAQTEIVSIYSCGLVEHKHADACYDAEGYLICQLQEHSHADSGCELTVSESVAYVIGLIDALPSADEIDAKIAEFEAAGDIDGEEAWLEQVYRDVTETYLSYCLLTEEERAAVYNAEKLLELEYIWSATTYNANFWKAPTPLKSASTSDFITLNLYDYGSNINNKFINETYTYGGYSSVPLWPGFQWNGGAYKKDDTFHRHQVDYIDFGNSLITDLAYGSSSADYSYGKASGAVGVGKLYTNSSAKKTGIINTLWWDGSDGVSITNRPIGMSMNSSTSSTTYDVLKPILTPQGYPVILASDSVSGFSGVLDYLFSSSDYATKKNTESIDGLFQIDSTGAYYYNSRVNHAQYSNNKFTLYKEVITPNFIVYPFGNFMPFNSITNSSTSTNIGMVTGGNLKNYIGQTITKLTNTGDTTKEQLKTMLGLYRTDLGAGTSGSAWDTWSALDAIQDYFWGDGGSSDDTPSEHTQGIIDRINAGMYNIDFDVKKNFFFGMDMSMQFYQPKNGKTGYDTNNDGMPDYDMKFYFTGDDDVWVFVDGILFLDLTGIHRHVGGEIDFVNGVVNYYELEVEGTGDVGSTPYQTFTFKDLVTKAVKFQNRNNTSFTDAQLTAAVNAIVNPETGRFYDYSSHTFKFFYMERGSGSSVCRMNFNFPMLRQNTLSVEKALANDSDSIGNPDFLFQVLDAEDNSQFLPGDWAYSLYDKDGSVIQEIKVASKYPDGRVKKMTIEDRNGNILCTEEYSSDGTRTSQTGSGLDKIKRLGENGVFALKAGQRAEFVGIPESWGKYYVRELLDHINIGQYDTITVSGEAANIHDVSVGGIAYTGADSPVLDMTNGSSVFRVENKINTAKLSSLSITKRVNTYQKLRNTTYYKLQVELDGQPLPSGLTYTVTSEDGTTRTDAVIIETDEAGNKKSFIQITADETATINNILSGSRFTIVEDPESAKGFNVLYNQTGAGNVTTGSSISGTIQTGSNVAATVTNSENGTQLETPISGTKRFLKAAEANHSYTFVLEQVLLDEESGTVTTLADGAKLENTVNFTGDSASFSFDSLTFLAREFKKFPATRYYLLYETGETATALDNTQQFLIKVTISQDTTSSLTEKPISAAITGVWEGYVEDGKYVKMKQLSSDTSDGFPVKFVNTLKDNLLITKTVDGSESAKLEDFAFALTLEAGTSGVETEGKTFRYRKTTADGTELGAFRYNGTAYEFALKHGETLEVLDLPVGTVWAVTETERAGYLASWHLTAGGTVTTRQSERAQNGDEGIVPNGNRVDFTNTATYALPETGGAGTTSYTMAGLVLITIGAAYLAYSKKRRREAQ